MALTVISPVEDPEIAQALEEMVLDKRQQALEGEQMEDAFAEQAMDVIELRLAEQHRHEVLEHYREVFGVEPADYATAEHAWLYANNADYRRQCDLEELCF